MFNLLAARAWRLAVRALVRAAPGLPARLAGHFLGQGSRASASLLLRPNGCSLSVCRSNMNGSGQEQTTAPLAASPRSIGGRLAPNLGVARVLARSIGALCQQSLFRWLSQPLNDHYISWRDASAVAEAVGQQSALALEFVNLPGRLNGVVLARLYGIRVAVSQFMRSFAHYNSL